MVAAALKRRVALPSGRHRHRGDTPRARPAAPCGASPIGYSISPAGRALIDAPKAFCDLDDDVPADRRVLLYFAPAWEAGYRGERLSFQASLAASTCPSNLRPLWRHYLLEGRSCRAELLRMTRLKAKAEAKPNHWRDGRHTQTTRIEYADARTALASLLDAVVRDEEDERRHDEARAAFGLTTEPTSPGSPPRPDCPESAAPCPSIADPASRALLAGLQPCAPMHLPRRAARA